MKTLKMMVYNDDSVYGVQVEVEKNELVWDRVEGLPTVVDDVLKDKDAASFLTMLRNRVGGKPLEEVLEVIKANGGRSVKDHTTFEVVEVL